MSAMAQVKIVVEKEPLLEEIVVEDLPEAVALIEQLQKEAQELRARLAEKNRLAEQKQLLYSIALIQEQALRSKLVRV